MFGLWKDKLKEINDLLNKFYYDAMRKGYFGDFENFEYYVINAIFGEIRVYTKSKMNEEDERD